jgi:8-oxo-dGTP pyrophosphatase MutT (NUDIX family)
MRQLNISIGVLIQNGTYLLQLRGNDPKIGAAGKIGAFGGKIENGETPEQAIRRELAEETSLQLKLDQITPIGTYRIKSDHRLEEVSVQVNAFEIVIDDTEEVVAIEGDIVKVSRTEIGSLLEKMTPATRYYFEKVKEE